MKIVYVDLHENVQFVKSFRCMVLRRRAISKQRFLLSWALKNNIEVVNYVSPGCPTVPIPFLTRILGGRHIRKWIATWVLKKNGIYKTNIKTIAEADEIAEGDIVIYYGSSAYDSAQFDNITGIPGIKVVDYIHFYGDKERADLLKNKGIQYYMFEVDLGKYSKLFKDNYASLNQTYIERPYVYGKRFKVKVPFEKRKNRAVAMGTLTKCELPEFIYAYNTIYYQPHRKMILDHEKELKDVLDSYISEYLEKPSKKIGENDRYAVKLYKKLYNANLQGKQKSYFSFDMVDMYNEYKMFICPEDINGSYGIGTIEGMACGCAMIGWNYGAFEDMGMVAGQHYIAYDGTLEDLRKKIEYYQMEEHQEELRKIARTGCRFVRERFSEERVAREYFEKLFQISQIKYH